MVTPAHWPFGSQNQGAINPSVGGPFGASVANREIVANAGQHPSKFARSIGYRTGLQHTHRSLGPSPLPIVPPLIPSMHLSMPHLLALLTRASQRLALPGPLPHALASRLTPSMRPRSAPSLLRSMPASFINEMHLNFPHQSTPHLVRSTHHHSPPLVPLRSANPSPRTTLLNLTAIDL